MSDYRRAIGPFFPCFSVEMAPGAAYTVGPIPAESKTIGLCRHSRSRDAAAFFRGSPHFLLPPNDPKMK